MKALKKGLAVVFSLLLSFGVMVDEAAAKGKVVQEAACPPKGVSAQATSTQVYFCWPIPGNSTSQWAKFNPDGSSTRDYGLSVPNNGVIKIDFHEVDVSPFDFTVTVYRENGGSVSKRAQNSDIEFTNMIGGNYSIDVTNNLGQPINVEFIATSDPNYVPIPYDPTPVKSFTNTINANDKMLQEITCYNVLDVAQGESITVKATQVEQPNYSFKVRVKRIGGGYVDHTFDQTTGQTTFTNMTAGQYKVCVQSLSGEPLYSTIDVSAHN